MMNDPRRSILSTCLQVLFLSPVAISVQCCIITIFHILTCLDRLYHSNLHACTFEGEIEVQGSVHLRCMGGGIRLRT